MTYLLDVNALVALGFVNHEFHARVAAWMRAQQFPPLATCSITELGFVRVLAQAPAYGFTVAQARTLLLRLKQANAAEFIFISDDHDISYLPAWVKTPKHTTDGHLARLAAAKGAILATLNGRIPGAYAIPDSPAPRTPREIPHREFSRSAKL
jgi:predicted nucleic acid-binding protein